MIKEDYVTFEQANLLKQKGFNGKCYTFYDMEDRCHSILNGNLAVDRNYYKNNQISCPTLSLVQKWLREEKNIRIHIHARDSWDNDSPYEVQVNRERLMNGQKGYNEDDQLFYTYEEALSAGIDKALELI